jgi:hypothetical protein
MDEKTKELLLKYLEAGADRLERGAAFVEAEIPLVVTEYLSWYWWNSMIAVIFWMFIFGIGVLLLKACHYSAKELEKEKHNSESGWIHAMVFSFLWAVFFCVLGLSLTCVSGKDLIKVSVAPRVVILEKIAEVTK